MQCRQREVERVAQFRVRDQRLSYAVRVVSRRIVGFCCHCAPCHRPPACHLPAPNPLCALHHSRPHPPLRDQTRPELHNRINNLR
jgi:hypothetical protein